MPYKNEKEGIKNRKSSKNYYWKHRDYLLKKSSDSMRLRRIRNRSFIRDYLEEHPCIDCGVEDFRVLDFDHVRGAKKAGLSGMKKSGCSIKTLEKEISKCEIRCANCHRIKHYGTFK